MSGLGFGVQAAALTGALTCKITEYWSAPYSERDLRKLVPAQQTHRFSKNSVRWQGVVGEVYRDDTERLRWRYDMRLPEDPIGGAVLSYSLIRKTGMVILRVQPKGLQRGDDAIPGGGFRFFYEPEIDTSGTVPLVFSEPVSVDRIVGHCSG